MCVVMVEVWRRNLELVCHSQGLAPSSLVNSVCVCVCVCVCVRVCVCGFFDMFSEKVDTVWLIRHQEHLHYIPDIFEIIYLLYSFTLGAHHQPSLPHPLTHTLALKYNTTSHPHTLTPHPLTHTPSEIQRTLTPSLPHPLTHSL